MIPSFQEIVKIALSTGISVVEIMKGTVSSEGDAPGQTTASFPGTTAQRNSYRSRMVFLEKELRSSMDQDGSSRSVASICREVGVPTRYAWLHWPDLAREVSERRKRLLRASFEERERAFENELFRMLKDVRERGIYPSLKLIETNITRKAKLRKDQKRFLWKGGAEEAEDSC